MFVINPASALTELSGIGKSDAQVFDNTAIIQSMQVAQRQREHKDLLAEKKRQGEDAVIEKQIAGLGDEVFERDMASFQQEAKDISNWALKNIDKLREGDMATRAEWNNMLGKYHQEAAASNQTKKNYFKNQARIAIDRGNKAEFYSDTEQPWTDFAGEGHVRDNVMPKAQERKEFIPEFYTSKMLPVVKQKMANLQRGESEITQPEAEEIANAMYGGSGMERASREELLNKESFPDEYLQSLGFTEDRIDISPREYFVKKTADMMLGKRTPIPRAGYGFGGGGSSTQKQATVTRRDDSTEMFTPLSKVEVISVGGKQFNINAVHSTFDKQGKLIGGYAVDADVAAENNRNHRQRSIENKKLDIEVQKLKEEYAPLIADPSYNKEGKATILKELETLTTGIKNRRDMINVSYPTDLNEQIELEQQQVIELQSSRLRGAHPEEVVSGAAKNKVAITENDERTKKGATTVKAKTYTAEQEAEISKNMKANPLYSREEIIKALNY